MKELVRVFNLKDFKSKIYQKVQKQIKYKFSSISLLSQALIHPSFNHTEKNKNYERLEFLGDRVIGLIIGDFLFKNFASESEGDLSQRFSVLVSGETILKVSKHIICVRHGWLEVLTVIVIICCFGKIDNHHICLIKIVRPNVENIS